MSTTPATERPDRKSGCDTSVSVARARDEIKKWLSSNPPTPTHSSFHPTKDEKEDKAPSQDQQDHSLTEAKEHGGVSLLTTEGTSYASATGASDRVSPQREQQENPGHGPTRSTSVCEISSKDQQPHMTHQDLTLSTVIPAEEQAPASMTSQVLDTVSSSQGQKKLKTKRSMSSWSVSDEPSNINNDERKKEVTGSEEIAAPYVISWLPSTAEPPTLTFSFDSPDLVTAYKHDVDTCTGELVPEIQYPETLQNHHLGPCRDHRDIAWRQANMTSELHITREVASRQKLAAQLRSQLQPEQEQTEVEVEEDTWPNADCKLRPTTPNDFGHIAEIMNLERREKNCPQVLESKDARTSDVRRIFNSCRDNLRPFIVATEAEDELLDRSKWPKNADKAHRDYMKFKRSQANAPAAILGFAFVADARIGFLDTSCPGSRFTGQIKIVVHPSHRGNLYGSALLDRILLSVALCHRSLVDYEWHCPNPELIYETPSGYNRRQYAWVYIETFCTGKRDADSTWRAQFLEKFQFKQVAYLPDAVKTDRFFNSQWLDLALWALEVQCRSKITDRPVGKSLKP